MKLCVSFRYVNNLRTMAKKMFQMTAGTGGGKEL